MLPGLSGVACSLGGWLAPGMKIVGVLPVLSAAAVVTLVAGCSSPNASPVPTVTEPASVAPVQSGAPLQVVQTEMSQLAAPWSMVFFPDGSALISERDTAKILHGTRSGGGWITRVVTTVPGVNNDGEGGLLGLAVQPGSNPAQVYAYWSTANDNRVGQMTWDGQNLSSPQVIFQGIPHASFHNGGRILFGSPDKLFVATGDAGQEDASQDRDSLAGKILRINADGSVPPDNPFGASPVYSYGHRNVQGLAWDEQGQLWATEFGSKDADELNRITAGSNYGWPIVEGRSSNSDFVNPVVEWRPTSTASPSGLAISGNSAWIASLRGECLWQVDINQANPVPVQHLTTLGRLRDVVVTPEQGLWVMTNNTDGRGDPQPNDDQIVSVQVG